MNICQTSGIVIKSRDWKESSKLITLYTADYGKLKAIAKGLKAKKGKGKGGLAQFSENEIVFYKKRSGLHLIDKWSFKNSNLHLYGNLKKLVVASILAEMINEYIEAEERSSLLYQLLKTALRLLARDGCEETFLAAFTVHFLKTLGYKPDLNRCCRCGTEKLTGSLFFSLGEGGIVCRRCKTDRENPVVIEQEMKSVIEYIQNTGIEKSGRLKLVPSFRRKLCDFLILFLSYTLGKEMKSVSLLETAVA